MGRRRPDGGGAEPADPRSDRGIPLPGPGCRATAGGIPVGRILLPRREIHAREGRGLEDPAEMPVRPLQGGRAGGIAADLRHSGDQERLRQQGIRGQPDGEALQAGTRHHLQPSDAALVSLRHGGRAQPARRPDRSDDLHRRRDPERRAGQDHPRGGGGADG